MMKRSICIHAKKTGPQGFREPSVLVGNVGLIFTKGNLKEDREDIHKYKLGAPAHVGLVAPIDVVVPWYFVSPPRLTRVPSKVLPQLSLFTKERRLVLPRLLSKLSLASDLSHTDLSMTMVLSLRLKCWTCLRMTFWTSFLLVFPT